MTEMVWARAIAAVILVTVLAIAIPTRAGHEATFLPSYYPQEIRIESVDSTAAAGLLQRAAIHAVVGDDLFGSRPAPDRVATVESLGAYVVVTLNSGSDRLRDRATRCTLATRLSAILARRGARYVFHPYPVTPYHRDYLEHYDLAESSKQSVLNHPSSDEATGRFDLTVRADGALAEALAQKFPPRAEAHWDALIETVDVADLLTAAGTDLDGWRGPPWLKDGWFAAYLLLADKVMDQKTRAEVSQLYHRLVTGDYRQAEEKAGLARALVTLLRQGCERVVLGYTERRAYVNVDYSQGIENVGYDSHFGVASPIFVRTAKLKDFPWNGQLRVGVAASASAAWNPIRGFGDAFGRLLWSVVGDPALLPGPYEGSWIPNRVTFRLVHDDSWLARLRRLLGAWRGSSEAVEVPPDALIPQQGSGRLDRVGPGKRAGAKLEYRVLASDFHDGTRMTSTDVLYPYIFAFRWSDTHVQEGRGYDPVIDRATALVRQHLVGVRALRTETVVRNLGADLQLKYDVHVIEVYLDSLALDLPELASIAPPWSTVPWHLMVLMEAAVSAGVAAFSAEEAAHRGVPWLDLVRVPRLQQHFGLTLDEFERRSYVPDPLKGLVTPEEAKERWRTLREFSRSHGHVLVTNGPYRLRQWSEHAVVLDVFRNLSYPLGVGSFDKYVRPRRGYVAGVTVQEDRLKIDADVERVIKFERNYRIVRERLGSNTSGAIDQVNPICRYVMVRADGQVVKDAMAAYGSDGAYTADVGRGLPPGVYTVMIAVYLNENAMNPAVKIIQYRRQ